MSMTDAVLSRVARRLLRCPFESVLFDDAEDLQSHLLECHEAQICQKHRIPKRAAEKDSERPEIIHACGLCLEFMVPKLEGRNAITEISAHLRETHSDPNLPPPKLSMKEMKDVKSIDDFMTERGLQDVCDCRGPGCNQVFSDTERVAAHWISEHVEAPNAEDVKHALESDPERFQERFGELLAAEMEAEEVRTRLPAGAPDDGYAIQHLPSVPRVRSRPGEFIVYIERALRRIREDELQEYLESQGLDGDQLTGGDWGDGERVTQIAIELRFCNIVDGFIPLVKDVRGILPPLDDGAVVEVSWQDDPEKYLPCKFSRSKRAIYNLDGWLKRVFMDFPSGERRLPSGVRLYIRRTGQRRYQLSLKWHPHVVRNCKFFVRDGAGGWNVEIRDEQVDWETGNDVFRHQLTFSEMDALHAEALSTNLSIRDAVHDVMSRYARIESWRVREIYEVVFLELRTCSLAAVWAQFRPEHECYVRVGPGQYRFDPNGAFPEVHVLAPRRTSERVVVERVRGDRAPASRLRVVVHWSKIFGDWCPDQEFAGMNGGKNQARFIGSLINQFPDLADRLKAMPVSRTYPLSDNPKRGFVNQSTQMVFPHQPVPGTQLFLFTNTSNEERREDILNLVKRLGFEGSVEVIVTPGISRIDWLNSLL